MPNLVLTDSRRHYWYRGDRMTAPELRGRDCLAVVRADGKCITGRGAMLVLFHGETVPRVILRRQLRKKSPTKEQKNGNG